MTTRAELMGIETTDDNAAGNSRSNVLGNTADVEESRAYQRMSEHMPSIADVTSYRGPLTAELEQQQSEALDAISTAQDTLDDLLQHGHLGDAAAELERRIRAGKKITMDTLMNERVTEHDQYTQARQQAHTLVRRYNQAVKATAPHLAALARQIVQDAENNYLEAANNIRRTVTNYRRAVHDLEAVHQLQATDAFHRSQTPAAAAPIKSDCLPRAEATQIIHRVNKNIENLPNRYGLAHAPTDAAHGPVKHDWTNSFGEEIPEGHQLD